MCGRYYVDDDTAKEIEKLVKQVDERMKQKSEKIHLKPKDIHPSEVAPVISADNNASMMPVHDRMPLLLDRDDIGKWIFEDQLTANFLQKTPPLLERRVDFEQMSLFPMGNSK